MTRRGAARGLPAGNTMTEPLDDDTEPGPKLREHRHRPELAPVELAVVRREFQL